MAISNHGRDKGGPDLHSGQMVRVNKSTAQGRRRRCQAASSTSREWGAHTANLLFCSTTHGLADFVAVTKVSIKEKIFILAYTFRDFRLWLTNSFAVGLRRGRTLWRMCWWRQLLIWYSWKAESTGRTERDKEALQRKCSLLTPLPPAAGSPWPVQL